jgi:S-adenosylmethionine hydrolase
MYCTLRRFLYLHCILFLILGASAAMGQNALVLQTDFGIKDAAVATMRGVAFGVSPGLNIFDLTHEIPPYNIWEGAYRLEQTASYWPPGTVFVSVVDPGVGTDRKSVVLKTKTGHYFVTPDNGTLTLVSESLGIQDLREIDEAVHRLGDSERSYTFHGRDVYAYTGAKLAAGIITVEEVGRELPPEVVKIERPEAVYRDNGVSGYVPILDIRYGNVWTNIDRELFAKLNAALGDVLHVTVKHKDKTLFNGNVRYVRTFGDVEVGAPLLYMNSLDKLSIAINMDDFARTYGVHSGPDYTIEVRKKNTGSK